MSIRMIPLAGLLLTGCNGTDNGGFSNGGTYNVNDYLSETDTGTADDDTEDTVPEGTPDIGSFVATIDNDYPGYDFVFALEVAYTDDDDNVDGGYLWCQFEVDGGNAQDCSEQDADGNDIVDGKLPISLNPYDDNSTIYAYLDPGIYDEDQSFYFEVALVDTDGNTSTTMGVAVQ
ncbi:MAG: hypothetical protein ACI8RZ_002932 [Myxococcota bacterium]|jgi:hypothetical protein